MILFQGSDGDIIAIYHNEDLDISMKRIEQDHCMVLGCCYGHIYGYNFCNHHEWILPISAHLIKDGFQVALIEYWKSQRHIVWQTNRYEGEKIPLKDKLKVFVK
jgi:hypothetical protein